MRIAYSIALVALLALLAACGAPGATPSPAPAVSQAAAPSTPAASGEVTRSLTGTTWQWVGLTDPTQEVTIDNPQNYTLTLADDGTVAIKADCNSASGSFTAGADGTLMIEVGPTTLVGCPPGSRGDEFTQSLGAVTRYFFRDGSLFVEMMADGGTLRFDAAP